MKRLASKVSLAEFFEMINIYFYNFRVLHWKVKGDKFDTLHSKMSEYYEELDTLIDLIAETMLANDIEVIDLKAITNSGKYELLKVDKDYTYNETIDNIELMFGDIINYIERLLNEDEVTNKNAGFKSNLEDYCAFFEVELNYKNKRRV